MSRVVLAMSGGVDSSVAAWLLRRAGHEVIGVFMRHGAASTACATPPDAHGANPLLPIVVEPLGHKQGCCTASDAADARRVAERLDIPFYALNFEEEFGRIMDYFVEEYRAGRTPNPCVVCNTWLKFGALAEYADSVGAEFIATGHYVRLAADAARPGAVAMLRGVDSGKDQSYVLFGIARDLLPRLLFPVGEFRKAEIREMAREVGLRVADKKDSQEICFVPDGDYAAFVRRRSQENGSETGGELVTTEGEVVGQHAGIENFTIGQRHGLGVTFGEPRYVVRLESDTRRVIIGRREALARVELTARRTNWLINEPRGPLRCAVKIRYLSRLVAATVEALPDQRMYCRFDEPREAIAPGQAVVCYNGDRVLGGGWIE